METFIELTLNSSSVTPARKPVVDPFDSAKQLHLKRKR
jgi:hypothetical protein